MFKPAKPHGERKPLMNMVIPPRKAPALHPKITPTTKEMMEVNSILGGLGVSCMLMHRAVNTLSNASWRVFMEPR